MAMSAIALSTRALIKLGARGISAFGEESAEAEVAGLLYPPIRDGVLSSHPWSFATAVIVPARLAEDPVDAGSYGHAYQLPSDFLRVLSVRRPGGRPVAFTIRESRLLTDSQPVQLTYVFRPPEEAWPPFFDTALIAALAAEFCLPLIESTSRADVLARQAQRALGEARRIDSQQTGAPALETFPLTDVRGVGAGEGL